MDTKVVPKKFRLSLCNKNEFLPEGPVSLDRFNVYFTIHDSINDIRETWDATVVDEHFSRSSYLRTIERDSPDHLKNLYLLLYSDSNEVIGAILLQSLVLNFSESFRYENYSTDHSFLARMLQKFRQAVVSTFKARILIVGNLYLTGHYGFNFVSGRYDNQDQFSMVNAVLKILRKELCNTPYRFQGVLYKDFFKHHQPESAQSLRMSEFEFDPNMILAIRKSWVTFDDFLLDMRSKYRIRLKNAIRKFGPIQRKVLSLEEVGQYNDRIYYLYNNLLKASGFVLVKGEKNYFLSLKEELGDELHFMAYFLNEKLIGFYTWVLDGEKMDSHFIGFDMDLNRRHQLYFNILLDLVRDAIKVGASSLYYFRTALEIKSSLGAAPHQMSCYFRHNNFLINTLVIPPAFKYFVPKQSWQQRHPFKTVALQKS